MLKRIFLISCTLLLMAIGTSGQVFADKSDHEKPGITEDADKCKKDGYKNLTDDKGKPFKNQGQCMKFVNHGGSFADADTDKKQKPDKKQDATASPTLETAVATSSDAPKLDLIDGTEPWDGLLQGSGFMPGAEITKVTFESDRDTLTVGSPVGTVVDDDGTFQTERNIYWCSEYHGYGETRGTVTVEDSSGASYSQTFEMSGHCGERE